MPLYTARLVSPTADTLLDDAIRCLRDQVPLELVVAKADVPLSALVRLTVRVTFVQCLNASSQRFMVNGFTGDGRVAVVSLTDPFGSPVAVVDFNSN